MQLSLSRHAREVADDDFLTDFGDVIKVWWRQKPVSCR